MSGLSARDQERLARLAARLVELGPEERAGFVSAECADSPDLRRELERIVRGLDRDVSALLAHKPELRPDPLARVETQPSARIGERAGQWVLAEVLGEGGFGVVYRATQHEPVERDVALKMLKRGMDSAAILARFDAERRLLARLAHPSIAAIFDAGLTADGCSYYVMELVRGASIASAAVDAGLTIEERLRLFLEVCEAVAHAHRKGVVHRDLKPANVLAARVGDRWVVKIIDFGIAKVLDRDERDTPTLTHEGQHLGTPAYMSPEQFDTSRDIDTRADVYSLGVLLFELLTGEPAIDPERLRRASWSELQRIVLHEDLERPSQRVKRLAMRPDAHAAARRLAGDLDWIVARATEKDRERRYPSVEAFAADIVAHLAHEPVIARPPSRVDRARKFAQRNRAFVAATSVGTLALMIGLAGTTWFALQAREELEARERLVDPILARDLVRELDGLWPRREAELPRFDRWLRASDDLLSRRERYDTELAGLGTGASDPFRAQTLERCVADLATLARARDIVASHRDYAARIAESTVEREREAWKAAIDAIARAPQYAGLSIVPQVGLVPLGPDPQSGLWEFWHVESGERPIRDPGTGKITPSEAMGIVLVLVPGGEFTMGAQRVDPSQPNFDPNAHDEERVRGERVAPVFVSKYELTQSQWYRLSGKSDNGYGPSVTLPDAKITLVHPAARMTWFEARDFLARYELRLPSEVEWEWAARARSTTPWWTGDRVESIGGAANVLDRRFKDYFRDIETCEQWLDDGFIVHGPVGSLRANGFGLHDVVGNVFEWCADLADGESADVDSSMRVIRSGSYGVLATECRSSARIGCDAKQVDRDLGIRPARSVQAP